MDQDLLDALQRAYPVTWIFRQQTFDQRLDLLRHCRRFGKLRLRMQDSLEDLLLLRGIEGRPPKQQLIEQYAKRIEIHLIGMPRST